MNLFLDPAYVSAIASAVADELARRGAVAEGLLAYPVRTIVVEASWADLGAGEWRSQVTPAAAVGSCLGWSAAGVLIVKVGNRERAARYISRLVFLAAHRRWREARPLVEFMLGEQLAEASA